MIRRLAAGAAVFALLCGLQARASDDDLEITFNDHCRECHSFLKDDNRLGPSLYGIIGRKAGSLEGFAYSELLKDFRRDVGRADARQMDRQSGRGDPRQPDEPALRRRRRCGDQEADHRLSEDDLAAGRWEGSIERLRRAGPNADGGRNIGRRLKFTESRRR